MLTSRRGSARVAHWDMSAHTMPSPCRFHRMLSSHGHSHHLSSICAYTCREARELGDVVGAQVSEPWFEVVNRRLGARLRYEWDIKTFPWLCIWTEHRYVAQLQLTAFASSTCRSRSTAPWGGVTRSRGLEFSTKPFPEGKPAPERAESFNMVPTYHFVPNEGSKTTFSITWTDK